MLGEKRRLIVRELEEGTGAAIGAEIDQSGARTGLRVWFADLDLEHGPVADLRPYGLRGHRVELRFGRSSGLVVRQIADAPMEAVQLARALITSVHQDAHLEIPSQSLPDWQVADAEFRLIATLRDLEDPLGDQTLTNTCRAVMVPIMAAMAELIGYSVVEPHADEAEGEYEGAVLRSLVTRRERNPRNRLLCIRVHGEVCAVCNMRPKSRYGVAGSIIEVHHLQPLSLLGEPRKYDPETDLVPLCPSCHSAVHTRRPVPLTLAELKESMDRATN